jgi:hypothetical protein
MSDVIDVTRNVVDNNNITLLIVEFYVLLTVHLGIINDHLYTVTYTRCRTDTINSPDDGYMAARNM